MTAYPDGNGNDCAGMEGNISENARKAFINGNMPLALELFTEAEKFEPDGGTNLFYIGLVNYMLCGADPENRREAFLPHMRRAFDAAGSAEAIRAITEKELGGYLGMASVIYAMNHAFSDIDDIISPGGIQIIKLFQFANIASEEFDIQYGDDFSRSIGRWIDSLTMRLFQQAGFSGIRLKLPVELITKTDIENAQMLFDWLDSVCEAILNISSDSGARFYELEIAFKLDLIEKCMPVLKDVCRAYTYYLPSQLYESDMEIERAKSYAFLILSVCYSLYSYDVSLQMRFVESVPLLRELRIVRSKGYHAGPEDIPANPPAQDIYYEIPKEEYRHFVDKARKLIRIIRGNNMDYTPPPYYSQLT